MFFALIALAVTAFAYAAKQEPTAVFPIDEGYVDADGVLIYSKCRRC